jgi:hypothetical protein
VQRTFSFQAGWQKASLHLQNAGSWLAKYKLCLASRLYGRADCDNIKQGACGSHGPFAEKKRASVQERLPPSNWRKRRRLAPKGN